jgi:hypothetical protein
MSANAATAELLASEAKRFLVVAPDSATLSISVFHAWQCGHCPIQRGLAPPHSVQV